MTKIILMFQLSYTYCKNFTVPTNIYIFFIEVQFLYTAVSVSAVQQSKSAICIHISPLFWISFPFRSPQSTEFPELQGRFSFNELNWKLCLKPFSWFRTEKHCCICSSGPAYSSHQSLPNLRAHTGMHMRVPMPLKQCSLLKFTHL